VQTAAFDFHGGCQRVQDRLQAAGVDYLLVTPSTDRFYLIGLSRPQYERLTLLLLPREGAPCLILPRFERMLAEPLRTACW